jgi:hypothetical protein
VVSVLLAQLPEAADSLGAALSRAQTTWTKQAAGGETTVLAYDRGVTALVGRVTELRAKLVEAGVRSRELAAATHALHSVPADDLSGEGKLRHLERIAQAEAAEEALRTDVVRRCRLAMVTLAELGGRVGGKVDTLTMAQQACAVDGGAPSLCANVPGALAMYEALQLAVGREEVVMRGLCSTAW